MGKTIKSKAVADLEALAPLPTIDELRVKVKEIDAEVRARLGDRITPESYARGLLFEAAWASVECEKRLLALDYIATACEDLTRDLLHAVELGNSCEKADKAFTSMVLPLAKYGAQFSGTRRGPSRLYRKAVEILRKRDANPSAKHVYLELESLGEIVDGKPTLKAFSTQLSRYSKKAR